MKFAGRMASHPFNVTTDSANFSGTLYSSGLAISETDQPPLLLLHGAGVAGQLTWQYIVHFLQSERDVLVIDLPQMGDSYFLEHFGLSGRLVSEVAAESASDSLLFGRYMTALIELYDALKVRLGWQSFDLVGYSFGGLLAMHLSECLPVRSLILIEPAALMSDDDGVLRRRSEDYQSIAEQLFATTEIASSYQDQSKVDGDKAFIRFLDIVSPQRQRSLDDVAIKRLANERVGLSYGLNAVAQALASHSQEYVGWRSTLPGLAFVGGLSSEAMKARLSKLSEDSGWQVIEVPSADHGLVYVKPKDIARAMRAFYSSLIE